MSWRGEVGGIEAARQGHDVIMSPTSHCYFDFYQGYGKDEPLAIGSFLPLRKVYDYNPIPEELSAKEANHILGAQGNMWTEYMPTEDHVEYMLLPRMTALAEVVWTPQQKRRYDDFADRLARSFWRFDSLGINYASHILDIEYQIGPADRGISLMLSSREEGSTIRYSLDGNDPEPTSPAFREPIRLARTTAVRAAKYKDNIRSKSVFRLDYTMHKAAGKPIGLDALPHPTFGFRGRGALVNGILGSDTRFADGEWLGWYRWHLDAIIDLKAETRIDSVTLRFFNSVPEWIYLPKTVTISISNDGRDFTTAAEYSAFDHATPEKTVSITIPLTGITTEFLRVYVPNFGTIPEGKPGVGNYTWLFVDEIIVH
jgi:hexosaminidase